MKLTLTPDWDTEDFKTTQTIRLNRLLATLSPHLPGESIQALKVHAAMSDCYILQLMEETALLKQCIGNLMVCIRRLEIQQLETCDGLNSIAAEQTAIWKKIVGEGE